MDLALAAREELRVIEKRDEHQRVISQSRRLLREAEVASARHETERLRRQAADLAERAAVATQAARIDALTGLANRRALEEQMLAWMQPREDGTRKRFVVALIDIDHLKRINDTLGHETATRCCANCPFSSRAANAAETGLFARAATSSCS